MTTPDIPADTEREYVPTPAERIAEAIPTERPRRGMSASVVHDGKSPEDRRRRAAGSGSRVGEVVPG